MDNERGTLYNLNVECWVHDSNGGRCSPVDPWYHEFEVNTISFEPSPLVDEARIISMAISTDTVTDEGNNHVD